MVRIVFYDIESLRNAFTVALYKEPQDNLPDGHVDIFYLTSMRIWNFDEISKRIYEKNKNFKGTISYYDLRERKNGILFASIFGKMDDATTRRYGISNFPSDIDYQSKNIGNIYYLGGYNSRNYDMTMLAYFFSNTFTDPRTLQYSVESNPANDETSIRVTPQYLRKFNNTLFMNKSNMASALRPMPKAREIRTLMLKSGRHIDIARLNEKQSKVALKRLLGMLGYQILESDKLSDTKDTLDTFDELCDLIAYNVSDVVNLAKLAHHKVYESNLELKQGLLDSYPEIVLENYTKNADVSTLSIKDGRQTADSSSSQLAGHALCPEGHLEDIPAVSFDYPAINKAIEQNRQPENILAVTNEWFCSKFPDPLSEPRQYWQRVYRFYSYIEGNNFNNNPDPNGPIINTAELPRHTICMPYFDLNGNPTSCYVTFSVGGIHGAEYNKELFDAHMAKYNQFNEDVKILSEALSYYDIEKKFKVSKRTGKTTTSYGKPFLTDHPVTFDLETQGRIFFKLKSIEVNSKTYLASNYVNNVGKWKKNEKPQLFEKYNDPLPGCEPDETKYNCKKLSKDYTYTSYGLSEHEDFESYYPNMLTQLESFLNKMLGYDRYAEIFEQKRTLGIEMKDKSRTKEERARLSIKRNGTKLILNAASGAGDTAFDNPIRVPNKIISMRIIGQLFTWRIGQAQTFAGARVISTNTDGLYVLPVPPLTVAESRRILEEESKNIHVNIEPEPIYLISKDTNNRLEYDVDKNKLINASGGSLSCYEGPTPTQALSHPAALDKALCDYLLKKTDLKDGTDALDAPFDRSLGYDILEAIRRDPDTTDVEKMLFFQNVVASSPSTNSYNFYYTDAEDIDNVQASEIKKIVQHYNRVFYFHETPETVHMQRIHMRKATGLKPGQRPPHPTSNMLKWYCTATGEKEDDIDKQCVSGNKELAISKITGIEPSVNILIENHDLYQMTDKEAAYILDNLDMNAYLDLFESSFNNWRNQTPECEFDRKTGLQKS